MKTNATEALYQSIEQRVECLERLAKLIRSGEAKAISRKGRKASQKLSAK